MKRSLKFLVKFNGTLLKVLTESCNLLTPKHSPLPASEARSDENYAQYGLHNNLETFKMNRKDAFDHPNFFHVKFCI